ncbi:MAG: universal stress protein [Bacteroidota bacterium]|nr:universal stress protein [Bacteroidota bacterium]
MFVLHNKMQYFKNILIPVSNLEEAVLAADKAIELYADEMHSMHFVNVQPRINWVADLFSFAREKTGSKSVSAIEILATLKETFSAKAPHITIITRQIFSGGYTQALIQYINDNELELLIQPKRKNKKISLPTSSIKINKLVKQTGCALLTVTPSCLHHPIKSIVLPVSTFIPEKKIEMASALARKYNAHIYIITIMDLNDEDSKTIADAFYLTYKRLKDYGHSPQYKVLSGNHSADLLLRYANQVKADMILLNPGKETSIPGVMNKTIVDLLNPLSHLHILTLKPGIV